MTTDGNAVGLSLPRIDAYDKVTGAAMYAADLIPKGALVARVLHATIGNGLVKAIHCERAEALPGVVKVVTCFDVPQIPFASPGNPWTLDEEWQDVQDRLLLNRRVRYFGDDIAAVVAVDDMTARRALELIEVEYEEYPVCLDMFEAMKHPGIPVHEEFPDNIVGTTHKESGDFEEVIKEPGLIKVDKWYTVPAVKHCHIENPVSYVYEERGRLVVVSSTQMPHVLRRVIGQALGIPWGRIRVIKPCVGGGFGNKDDALYEPLNAFLCQAVGGRCVALELTREEDFVSTRTRHAMAFRLVTYARRDGTIAARKLESYSNQGAYASHGHAIVSKGIRDFAMLYKSDAFVADGYTIYTNMPCAGAMRGYGIVEITFAIEAHIDDVAKAIGMDPLDFRRKNLMDVGTVSEDKCLVNYTDSLGECLDRAAAYMEKRRTARAAEDALWRAFPEAAPGDIRSGCGSAVFWYCTGVWPYCIEVSSCRILLNQDGSFEVHIGENEIGQGADTAFTQIAADALKVSFDKVHVVSEKDTDKTPFGTGAYASRQTYVAGNAICQTAEIMLDLILERASFMTGIPVSDLCIGKETVCRREDSEPVLTYEAIGMDSFYSFDKTEHLIAEKTVSTKTNALTLGCCMADVAVNIKTGQIRVLDVINAHDCGRLINPCLAAAQVHGGMSMSLGYGLSEQLLANPATGQIRNSNLLDYKLLTAMDHPDHLGTAFVENAEPTSAVGVKGLGEPPALPVAPAIRNAVLDATGFMIDDLPMNPERCLKIFSGKDERQHVSV